MTQHKLASARYIIVSRYPYFAPMLALCKFVEAQVESMCINARCVIAYSAKWVDVMPTELVTLTVLHEINHVIRAHFARMGSRHPKQWNIACDMEINQQLHYMRGFVRDQFILPEDYNLPNGLTAEEYYARLPPESRDADSHYDLDFGASTPEATELGQDTCPGEVQAAISQTCEMAAKYHGSLPASIARCAPLAHSVQVNWSELLRGAIQATANIAAGYGSRTFRRLSRYQAALGYGPDAPIIPAHVQSRPNVVIAIDTSASMTQSELARAKATAMDVLTSLGTSIEIWTCDTKVQDVTRHSSVSAIQQVSLKGGGGTDFRPVFDRLTPKHDFLIFITDGDGTFPAIHPVTKVIWVLSSKTVVPPFGKTIYWA